MFEQNIASKNNEVVEKGAAKKEYKLLKEMDIHRVDEPSSIRVRLMETSDGEKSIDIRKFVSTERYQGPTKSGVFISLSVAELLVSVLTAFLNPSQE